MKAASSFVFSISPKKVLDNSVINKEDVHGRFMIGVPSTPKNKIDMGLIETEVNNSDVCRIPNDKKLKILLKFFISKINFSPMVIGPQNRVINVDDQFDKKFKNKFRIIGIVSSDQSEESRLQKELSH